MRDAEPAPDDAPPAPAGVAPDELAVREALAERNRAATAAYRLECRTYRSRTITLGAIAGAFVLGEAVLWAVRYARRAQIVSEQSDLRPWLTGSFLLYLVSAVMATVLVVAIVRHLRRTPVEPTLELPLDDPERRLRTLRPGYVAPRRW